MQLKRWSTCIYEEKLEKLGILCLEKAEKGKGLSFTKLVDDKVKAEGQSIKSCSMRARRHSIFGQRLSETDKRR